MEGKRRKKLFIIGGVRVDDVLHDVLDSRIRSINEPPKIHLVGKEKRKNKSSSSESGW